MLRRRRIPNGLTVAIGLLAAVCAAAVSSAADSAQTDGVPGMPERDAGAIDSTPDTTGVVLRATFVGNAAFLVSDGHVTLAIDFPYRSGASGSTRYDYDAVRPRGIVVCLVTHRHDDHFNPTLFLKSSWSLLAPPDLARLLRPTGYDIAEISEDSPAEFEGIAVEAFVTPHGEIEHQSYLVTWHGMKLFVTGDAENAHAMFAAGHVDAAFVSVMLAQRLLDDGSAVDADQVILCHHRLGMKLPDFPGAVVPSPGDVMEIRPRR